MPRNKYQLTPFIIASTMAFGGVSCPKYPVTENELSRTPRKNRNIEQLALILSEGYTADTDVYDRLVSDISTIRAKDSRVANVNFRPKDDGSLLVEVSSGAEENILDGMDFDWNCLNKHFHATSVKKVIPSIISVRFKGVLDMNKVGTLYKSVPGVESVMPSLTTGGGSTICVVRDDQEWHYVFDVGSGDCIVGCMYHELIYYRADNGKEPILMETWTKSPDSAQPAWAEIYEKGCKK